MSAEDGDAGGEAVQEVAAADGPISPAQNAPASGTGPSSSSTTRRVVVGLAEQCVPRPLHVNSSAAVAVRRRSSRRRRSSSAASASRTWNCTVWPTSTRSPTASDAVSLVDAEHVAHEEVAAVEVEPVLVDDEAEVQALAHELAVVVGRPPARSPGAAPSRAGPRARSTRLRSARVTVNGLPIGRQPCDTTGADRDVVGAHDRDRAARQDAVVERRAVRRPGRLPADARPPITVSSGTCALHEPRGSRATGNENGSASISSVPRAADRVGPARRSRSRRRSAIASSATPSTRPAPKRAANTDSPGPSSTSTTAARDRRPRCTPIEHLGLEQLAQTAGDVLERAHVVRRREAHERGRGARRRTARGSRRRPRRPPRRQSGAATARPRSGSRDPSSAASTPTSRGLEVRGAITAARAAGAP